MVKYIRSITSVPSCNPTTSKKLLVILIQMENLFLFDDNRWFSANLSNNWKYFEMCLRYKCDIFIIISTNSLLFSFFIHDQYTEYECEKS